MAEVELKGAGGGEGRRYVNAIQIYILLVFSVGEGVGGI